MEFEYQGIFEIWRLALDMSCGKKFSVGACIDYYDEGSIHFVKGSHVLTR